MTCTIHPPLYLAAQDAGQKRVESGTLAHANEAMHQSWRAHDAVTEVIDELEKAHQIISIALNALTPTAKRRLEQQVVALGLDGEGITLHHERCAALARARGFQ